MGLYRELAAERGGKEKAGLRHLEYVVISHDLSVFAR